MNNLTVGSILGPAAIFRRHGYADIQLVIATEGTAKTTTLVGKIERLVHEGVDPSGILFISLTNNTVADLRGAVKAEFGASSAATS